MNTQFVVVIVILHISTVFTVSISLDKTFYAFNKGTVSTIYVTVESEADEWSRIKLYEHSPVSKVQILSPINLDKSETVYTHPYQLSSPTSGTYAFRVDEISLYDGITYNTTASAEVHGKLVAPRQQHAKYI